MVEPVLRSVPIDDIRPTQMTVGLREVEKKRAQWRDEGFIKKGAFLGTHMIPVVLGPKERIYNIDHHHLLRALYEEDVKNVLVHVVAKLSHLEDMDAFWFVLDIQKWVFPWDEHGERRPYKEIPKTVDKLSNDVWRSLAGEVQTVGGFAKEIAPFSEFIWADFLRRRMKLKDVEKDFDDAVQDALKLARSDDAQYLPGWCGQRKKR